MVGEGFFAVSGGGAGDLLAEVGETGADIGGGFVELFSVEEFG